ncbi:MAG: transposase family protein [Gemmataceae bacterium]
MALSRLSLHKHIRRLQDPRIKRRKRHLLGDILTIAVCAVLADANTWPDIETFGHLLTVKDNQEHLREDIEACFIKAYDSDCQGIH